MVLIESRGVFNRYVFRPKLKWSDNVELPWNDHLYKLVCSYKHPIDMVLIESRGVWDTLLIK